MIFSAAAVRSVLTRQRMTALISMVATVPFLIAAETAPVKEVSLPLLRLLLPRLRDRLLRLLLRLRLLRLSHRSVLLLKPVSPNPSLLLAVATFLLLAVADLLLLLP